MTIRIHRSDQAGWTRLANEVLRDANLTLRAKGLLVQLLSHEDGWQQSLAYAEKQCADGQQSVRTAFRELIDGGYATRTRKKNPNGRFRWEYDVYEAPMAPDMSGISIDGDAIDGGTIDGEAHPLVDLELEVEPQVQKNPREALAPTASSRRNPIYEILFLLEAGLEYSTENNDTLTPTSRGALNKASAEIKGTGISPNELMAAIQAWPSVMGDATCTANAIAKHLPRLRAAARGNVARAHAPTDFDRTMAELERKRQQA